MSCSSDEEVLIGAGEDCLSLRLPNHLCCGKCTIFQQRLLTAIKRPKRGVTLTCLKPWNWIRHKQDIRRDMAGMILNFLKDADDNDSDDEQQLGPPSDEALPRKRKQREILKLTFDAKQVYEDGRPDIAPEPEGRPNIVKRKKIATAAAKKNTTGTSNGNRHPTLEIPKNDPDAAIRCMIESGMTSLSDLQTIVSKLADEAPSAGASVWPCSREEDDNEVIFL